MFSIILTGINFYMFKCTNEHITEPVPNLIQISEDSDLDKVNINNSFIQDFDYNTIKTSDLSQLKMPYINCNRRVFANSDKDLIDILLLDENLQRLIPKATSTYKSKAESVRHCIANILEMEEEYEFELSEEMNYTSENLLGVEIDSTIKKRLNDELVKFNEELKHAYSVPINRQSIQTLLEFIDDYIFEDIKCNNLFLYCLKSSIIFSNIFDKEIMNLDETIDFLINLIDIYKELWENVEFISITIFEHVGLNYPKDMFTSCVLLSNILTKWYIESDLKTINCMIMYLNDKDVDLLEHKIIYSNNANSILETLSQAINIITDEDVEMMLALFDIKKTLIPNNIFHTPIFNSYEITILDKKYLIKKFRDIDINSLPTGLSTAYLNIHGRFTSVGYMVFGNMNDDSDGSLFLSVEEMMDDFFISDNFEIFKSNENQVLWFILDFLHILDKLVLFRIKLTSPTLVFAVKKDDERWRFRVDDIGYFEYFENESPYEYYKLFTDTLESIYKTIKNQCIRAYIRHLTGHVNDLINAMHPYCFEILISELNEKCLQLI